MEFFIWWFSGGLFTWAYTDEPGNGLDAFIRGAFWPYFIGKQVRADVQKIINNK